jgi:O-antigen ligase
LSPNTSKNLKSFKNIAELNEPLLPVYFLIPLWLIALTLPNLIYSGVLWYETLHLTKWVVCGATVAIAGLIVGIRLIHFGGKKLAFKIDGFVFLWIILFVYLMIQPLWTDIRSVSSFVQEILCFAAVIGFYIMSLNSFPLRLARPLIWLANINGAINVLFAEIQTRVWLWEVYNEVIGDSLSIILPTPGNYIGNTGQQNMFGLWLAICIMNSAYLYVAYAILPSGKKRSMPVTILNLVLLFINCWGLWISTSRSAMLSLLVGLFVLIIMFLRLKADKAFIKRMFTVIVVFLVAVCASYMINPQRFDVNVGKTIDMIQNAESIGGRDGIWATSRSMFKMYPIKGVGIGQYKWHYLEAQRKMFDKYPDATWQYTHWAHNEFLQWFCEGGLFGGLIMVFMLAWWFISVVAAILKKKEISSEAIWANALIVLVLFNALWTRPFHRIENILWLSLAFALANREVLLQSLKDYFSIVKKPLSIFAGTSFVIIAIIGLWFLGDGMYGDRQIRIAMSTNNAVTQRERLMEAQKHIMVRLEAEKQLAYHFISCGEALKSDADLEEGLNRLLNYFKKEPHTQELNALFEWAQKLQNVGILKYLVEFLKPGSFVFKPISDETPDIGQETPAPIREESAEMYSF